MSLLDAAALPKYAGDSKRIQFKRNKKKSNSTWKNYRQGYNIMWKGAADRCRKAGLLEPGSYDPRNQSGGHMPCLPGDHTVTNLQARGIMLKLLESRLPGYWCTETELRKAKKCLSHIYQCKRGLGKGGGQWEGVSIAWEGFDERDCAEAKSSAKADPARTPTAKELYAVFKGSWSRDMGSLVRFSQERVALWCTGVNGGRKEDLERLKFGTSHDFNLDEGWAKTDYHGGRPKLCGQKKGRRPWATWFVCTCKGGEHQGLPEDEVEFEDWRHEEPPVSVTWDTGCVMNCVELLRRVQLAKFDHFKLFRKWKLGTGFTKSNEGPVLQNLAFPHFRRFGVTRAFDMHSGRKLCARWTRKEGQRFRVVFEMIADLERTWRKWYDVQLPADGYKVRTQSRNPDTACAALYAFARACGRGVPKMPQLNTNGMLLFELLARQDEGGREAAEAIVMGRPLKRRKLSHKLVKAAQAMAAEEDDDEVYPDQGAEDEDAVPFEFEDA